MSTKIAWTHLTLMALVLALVAPVASAKDPQLVPNRLSSTGDSITEAIDAEVPFANHWASWANGYTNFWTWLFGYTNVNSHNQRITSKFGSSGRKNFLQAVSGADSFDLNAQTQGSVANAATYVTMFMGHNDVCQNSFADIPSVAQFEANVRTGLDNLKNGLPNGATVYVLAIVDIYKLWELGDELTALGFIDCEVLWATSLLNLFPCGTMLSPLNSEADRQYTRSFNIAYNQVLADLVAEYEATDSHHHYVFTDLTFNYEFVANEVSGIDCFHPSALGQKNLARETWNAGPFGN